MYSSAFGLMFYFYQLNQKLVRTNPMLHEELYSNCFVITLRVHKLPEYDNSDVTSTWCSAYVCIANWPCNKSFVTLWNGTSELANQQFLWTMSRVYNKCTHVHYPNKDFWVYVYIQSLPSVSTDHPLCKAIKQHVLNRHLKLCEI